MLCGRVRDCVVQPGLVRECGANGIGNVREMEGAESFGGVGTGLRAVEEEGKEKIEAKGS